MNIDKLIIAAKEIDRLAKAQEERTKHLQNLAYKARHVEPNSEEHRRIKSQINTSPVVTDFGNAISDLRKALKAR